MRSHTRVQQWKSRSASTILRRPNGQKRHLAAETLESRLALAVAVDDAYSTVQNVLFASDDSTRLIADVMANDTLTPGATNRRLRLITYPANGNLVNLTTTLRYYPNYGFAGTDSFTYVIEDSLGTSEPATVTIEVVPRNAIPFAAGDSYLARVGQSLVTSATPQVLTLFVVPGSVWKYSTQNTAPPGWELPSFDDTDWTSGSGEFGIGDGPAPSARPESTTFPNGPIVRVARFRHAFDVPDPAAVPALTLGLMRDAAARVFLNGVEIIRDNLPGIAGDDELITYQTNTLSEPDGADEFLFQNYAIDPALLATGRNVLAVQVHAGGSTSDMSFELQLTATDQSYGVLSNDFDVEQDPLDAVLVTAPQKGQFTLHENGEFVYTPDLGADGFDYFTYRAAERGTGQGRERTVTIRLLRDNAIPLARADRYTVAEDGVLHVGPTAATIVSPGAEWRYLADGFDADPAWHSPSFDDASWSAGQAPLGSNHQDIVTTVPSMTNRRPALFRKTFEIADPSAIDVITGMLRRGDGAVVYLNGVELSRTNMRQGVINRTTDADANKGSVREWRPFSGPASLLRPGTNVIAVDLRQGNVDPQQSMLFDLALFAGGGVLTNDVDAEHDPMAATLLEPPQYGTIEFGSDGAFTYRPRGDYFGLDTFSYRVADEGGSSPPQWVAIDVVNQADAPLASEDVYELAAGDALNVTGVQTFSLLPAMPNWRYHDLQVISGAPPADWKEPGFDDSTWKFGMGSLGFGEMVNTAISNACACRLTYYFRTKFDIQDISAIERLLLEMRYDDGAIVWLNDQEVVRANLPGTLGDGEIVHTTPASGALSSETTYYPFEILPQHLRNGTNTLAIEVHNQGLTSGDLQIDVRLIATSGGLGVFANDHDPDGHPLAASLVAAPLHGSLVLALDGGFIYTPAVGFTGVDRFTYRVSDGQLTSEPTTVRIVVSPPGQSPQDLNADGAVNAGDLAFLLASYGKVTQAKAIEGDLDGDGKIGVRDAIRLRNAFTPAPAPSVAAAILARVSDRAIAEAESANLLRAGRRIRRFGEILSETKPAATDQALAAIVEIPSSLTGRRSRLLERTRG